MTKLHEPKKACFAYQDDKGGAGCRALNDMLCVTRGRCPFYKNAEQARKDAGKAKGLATQRGYYQDGGGYEPRGGENT